MINGFWSIYRGYGFAKTSKKNRDDWSIMIRNYMNKRTNLVLVFLLVDSRIEPQDSDLRFMEWMAEHAIPFVILMTKTDKLTKGKLKASEERYQEVLAEDWEELPDMVLTSAEKRVGRGEIWSRIMAGNEVFVRISEEDRQEDIRDDKPE
jgi:GTP-binding protein